LRTNDSEAGKFSEGNQEKADERKLRRFQSEEYSVKKLVKKEKKI